MRLLSRKLQQKNNFLKLGIGVAPLPPIDYNTALCSYSADYVQIQPYSKINTVPDCSADIDYCTWRVAESNSADYMQPGYLEGAYKLPEFSAQPVTYFGLSGDVYEQNRRNYFLKYYLKYKTGQLISWSGVNGEITQSTSGQTLQYSTTTITQKNEEQPNEDIWIDEFEKEYQDFLNSLRQME